MSPSTVTTLQSLAALFASLAAFLGGMYLVVTRPILGRLDDIIARLVRLEEKQGNLDKKVEVLEATKWR